MNIYDKLEQLSLTESEKTLIDYVIEHSEDIMNMSASDISKNSYVVKPQTLPIIITNKTAN